MLDSTDRRILTELQRDGRESYRNIAKTLEVSEGTVRKRVINLQQKGVLKIRAVLDPTKFGYTIESIVAFQIRMSEWQEIVSALKVIPNIRYLAFVTGRYDMIASVITHSTEELGELLKSHIYTQPGIIRAETFVNTKIAKNPWVEVWDIAGLV